MWRRREGGGRGGGGELTGFERVLNAGALCWFGPVGFGYAAGMILSIS